ncbi:MAG TPA: hypothetical protein VHC44_01240 [Verrucomicrobiae bacterium]|nr:hypothetical protein [Verrucomicrobiae bacterium]
MKKLSLVVLLGLALSAVVSGCNNSESSSSTPPATSTNAAPATPSTNAP